MIDRESLISFTSDDSSSVQHNLLVTRCLGLCITLLLLGSVFGFLYSFDII